MIANFRVSTFFQYNIYKRKKDNVSYTVHMFGQLNIYGEFMTDSILVLMPTDKMDLQPILYLFTQMQTQYLKQQFPTFPALCASSRASALGCMPTTCACGAAHACMLLVQLSLWGWGPLI